MNKFDEHKSTFEKKLLSFSGKYSQSRLPPTETMKKELKRDEKMLHESFQDLVYDDTVEKRFWDYCSLNTYKDYFQNRLDEFKEENPEATQEIFCALELKRLKNKIQKDQIGFETEIEHFDKTTGNSMGYPTIHVFPEGYVYLTEYQEENFKVYIEFKIFKLANQIDIIEKRKVEYLESLIQSKSSTEVIDDNSQFADINLAKAKEKIRLLYELKIIDNLFIDFDKNFGSKNSPKSTNSMALLLSKLIDVPKTTIQPYLSALLTENVRNGKFPKESAKINLIINALKKGEYK